MREGEDGGKEGEREKGQRGEGGRGRKRVKERGGGERELQSLLYFRFTKTPWTHTWRTLSSRVLRALLTSRPGRRLDNRQTASTRSPMASNTRMSS